jgi:3-oxoacyl-[acyl-carrier-protein] synthase II
LHALIRGALLIRSGEMKRVLVVAAESSLHPLFVANFQRLGVLPPPGFGCRPFDRDRRGFVMSEAAAAVVLESPDSAPRGAAARRPIALERFAFAGDATHLTGNDPQSRTLRHILASVIDGRPIDLAHAHGTGTQVNDAAEISALEATLPPGGPRPTLYSHKGAIGHSLGASGLVSVVLNCVSHRTGIIPGNVQTSQPMESIRLEIRQQLTERKVDRSLAVAAGFGGAMAAVSLRSLLEPTSV